MLDAKAVAGPGVTDPGRGARAIKSPAHLGLGAVNQRMLEDLGAQALSRLRARPPSSRPPDSLPLPVRRHLAQALPADAPPALRVRLTEEGRMRSIEGRRRWLPFTARCEVYPHDHTFLWLARARAFPGIKIHVFDRLSEGEGVCDLGCLGLLLVRHTGPELAEAVAHRLLAEALWYPSFLRDDPSIDWFAIDAQRVRARLNGKGFSVELEFGFGPDGLISEAFTWGRWAQYGSRLVQTAWRARGNDYGMVGGVLVPRQAEVAWYVEGDWLTVWEGRLLGLETEPWVFPAGTRSG